MNGYRAYVIGPDGHIQNRVDLYCEDDEAAKVEAAKLVDGVGIELWQLNRRICEFKATEAVAPTNAPRPDHGTA